MVGYAVSSFVDGFFKGRDWRDAKDARKRDEERQARLDKMDEDLHQLRLREFGLREEEFGLRKVEIERARALEQGNTDFFGDLAGTAPGAGAPQSAESMGLSMGVSPTAPAVAPAGRPAPPQPRLGFGAITAPAAVAGGGGADAVSGGSGADRIVAPAAAPSFETYGREVGNASISDQAAAARIKNEVARGNVQPRQDQAQVAPEIAAAEAALPGQIKEALKKYQPNPDHRFLQPGGLGADVREIGNRVGGATADAVAGTVTGAANAVNTVINPYVEYATGYKFPMAGEQPVAGPSFETTGRQSAPQADPAAEVGAPSPAAAASTAATKEAVAQVSLSFGLKPGENYTPKQVQSAAEATLQWYTETAAPKILQHYVATGQVEKATQFASLLESQAGKKAMERRAAAAFKAINGDIDGYGKDILEAYKAYGYVDPTFDIDEEATGVIRDESGNFAGAKLVFKDRQTGNRIEKLFETEQELIQYGLVTTDPATMVEMMATQQQQATGALTDVQKRVLDDANAILETNPDRALQGLPPITEQEAMQMAMARIATVTGQAGLGQVGASQGVDPRISGVGANGLYREP